MQHDTDAAAVPAHLQLGYRFSRVHHFDPAQVSAFAYAAGDTNPIHHDQQAAANTRFGKPIVSGTQSTALLMGLVASHMSSSGQAVGVKFSVELLRPVFWDEQVTLEWEVIGIETHPGGGKYLDLAGSVTGPEGDCRVRGHGRVLVWQ
jgi:acyl dehydratase